MSLKSIALDKLTAGSGYQFSATRIKDLGAAEYTLVTIVCDASSSVDSYAAQLETCLKTILTACAKSDRADNLMLRLVQFSQTITELHGFKLLNSINQDEPNKGANHDYNGILHIGGSTAAFDAADEAIQATAAYGQKLTAQEFLVNGIVFLITDGENNTGSILDPKQVAKSLVNARRKEILESITTVLVGVTGDNAKLNSYLQAVKDDAGFTQYIAIGSATPGKLAKLAQFVSQSISSTSSALGTGQPSQPLNFNF